MQQSNLEFIFKNTPDSSSLRRGEIKNGVILIYDPDEETAWLTLLHEVTEWRLKAVTGPYMRFINKLIEAFEAELYAQKEKALGQIMNDFMMWRSLSETLGSTKPNREEKVVKDH